MFTVLARHTAAPCATCNSSLHTPRRDIILGPIPIDAVKATAKRRRQSRRGPKVVAEVGSSLSHPLLNRRFDGTRTHRPIPPAIARISGLGTGNLVLFSSDVRRSGWPVARTCHVPPAGQRRRIRRGSDRRYLHRGVRGGDRPQGPRTGAAALQGFALVLPAHGARYRGT